MKFSRIFFGFPQIENKKEYECMLGKRIFHFKLNIKHFKLNRKKKKFLLKFVKPIISLKKLKKTNVLLKKMEFLINMASVKYFML